MSGTHGATTLVLPTSGLDGCHVGILIGHKHPLLQLLDGAQTWPSVCHVHPHCPHRFFAHVYVLELLTVGSAGSNVGLGGHRQESLHPLVFAQKPLLGGVGTSGDLHGNVAVSGSAGFTGVKSGRPLEQTHGNGQSSPKLHDPEVEGVLPPPATSVQTVVTGPVSPIEVSAQVVLPVLVG